MRICKVLRVVSWVVLAAIIPVHAEIAGQEPRHPLDALTAAEYNAVVAILRDGGRVDREAAYEVYARQKGQWKPIQRLVK